MTAPVHDPHRSDPSDWTVQAADWIESAVGLVRDRATMPLRTLTRLVVYGIALGVVAAIAGVLTVAAGIRALTDYLPVGLAPGHHHRVWVAYAIVGGIFTLAGLFLLRKAESVPREGTR